MLEPPSALPGNLPLTGAALRPPSGRCRPQARSQSSGAVTSVYGMEEANCLLSIRLQSANQTSKQRNHTSPGRF